MFNLLINFCVFVFIFYAVRWSARMILFGTKRKRRVSHAAVRAQSRRRAKIIKLNVQTTKRNDRLKTRKGFQPVFYILKENLSCSNQTLNSQLLTLNSKKTEPVQIEPTPKVLL